MGKQHEEEKNEQQTGTAKEKATFDQNGEGNSPKYGQAGDNEPNENGALEDQAFNKDKSKEE